MWRDITDGLRSLRHAPMATAAIVTTLAFGLAANVTIFSWLDALVYRPLSGVPFQHRLAVIDGRMVSGRDQRLSYPEVRDLSDRLSLVQGVAAYTYQPFGLSTGAHAERVWGQLVTTNFFDVLGVSPMLGRGFLEAEEAEGAGPVAVISESLWTRRFNRDGAILGRTIEINGHDITIVGVAAQGFHGVAVGLLLDVWIPVGMQPALGGGQGRRLESRDVRWFGAYARLNDGVTLAALRGELDAIGRQLAEAFPDVSGGTSFTANSLADAPWGGTTVVKPVLTVMGTLVAVLAFATCANVANLLLVRTMKRQRDIALRLSLGAARFVIVRRLLIESALLATLAAAAAAALALGSPRLFTALLPPTGFPIGFRMTVDIVWIAIVMMGAAAAMLAIGLAPAVRAATISMSTLREESGSVIGGPMRHMARDVFVGAQALFCAVLLVLAGAMVKALVQSRSVDPGFDTRHVLLASVDLSQSGYSEARGRAFLRRVSDVVRALPGVTEVSFAQRLPLDFGGRGLVPASIEGYIAPRGEAVTLAVNAVGPSYLNTLGIPLLAGRDFTIADDDRSERVAIVSHRAADMFWTNTGAIDRFVTVSGERYRIVGVSADIRQDALTQPPLPALLVPVLQSYRPGVVLHLSVDIDPASIAAPLRAAIAQIDPAIAVYDIRTMSEHMQVPTFAYRLGATLGSALGLFALLIAVLGLYASLSHTIQERRREIGVRLAIGASRAEVARVAGGRTVVLITAGIGGGLALAAAVGRVLSGILPGVQFTDISLLAGVGAVIIGAGAVGIVVPLRRLLSINPIVAIRETA